MRGQGTSGRTPLKRALILILGWVLVILGVVGLFLPFLQGVLFLLAGLYVLSLESKIARSWLERFRKRHPGTDRLLRKMKGKAEGFFRWFRREG
jgi:uncharacterized membrane protein YbaN (DUF454 family)